MTPQTYCPICAAALTAGAEFCGNCGTRVASAQPASSVVAGADYAGFWQRFLAELIDGIIVVFVGGVPGLIIGLLADSIALGYATYLVVYVLYFAWGNGSGGTWGKQIIGIRVVSRKSGGDIGFGAGLVRVVVWWIGSIPFYLGWLWMLWDSQKQTWHDKAVGSIVIKARP